MGGIGSGIKGHRTSQDLEQELRDRRESFRHNSLMEREARENEIRQKVKEEFYRRKEERERIDNAIREYLEANRQYYQERHNRRQQRKNGPRKKRGYLDKHKSKMKKHGFLMNTFRTLTSPTYAIRTSLLAVREGYRFAFTNKKKKRKKR